MGRRRASASAPPLSADYIVNVTLGLIDREGLQALSMRRIGAELGVEAMSLYHHFPNKEALLDAVMARGTPGPLPQPTGKWRVDLCALLDAARKQLSAHPALLPLRWARRTVSPEAEAVLRREKAIFKAAGLGKDLSRDAHRLLGSYVLGFVVARAEALRENPDADWGDQFKVGLEMLIDGIELRRKREASRKK